MSAKEAMFMLAMKAYMTDMKELVNDLSEKIEEAHATGNYKELTLPSQLVLLKLFVGDDVNKVLSLVAKEENNIMRVSLS